MTRPKLHPACDAFPPLSKAEQRALAADIKANGLYEPITLMPDGTILDGRCRWEACKSSGVEPQTTVYSGDDPVRFVLSKNAHRRHLDEIDRAVIAASLTTMTDGGDRRSSEFATNKPVSRREVAIAMNVTVESVDDVKAVKKWAAPHILDMVLKDKILTLSPAAHACIGTKHEDQEAWQTPDDVRQASRDKRAKAKLQAASKKPLVVEPADTPVEPTPVEAPEGTETQTEPEAQPKKAARSTKATQGDDAATEQTKPEPKTKKETTKAAKAVRDLQDFLAAVESVIKLAPYSDEKLDDDQVAALRDALPRAIDVLQQMQERLASHKSNKAEDEKLEKSLDSATEKLRQRLKAS